ncbi:MAG: PilW family protein [Gammaproteobacteria bacterium]|nr:PilW family protein [Gammaproteobacteria bacterium]
MNRFPRQAGLTLVELMVATTLSLVLLAGVLVVFSANKATYQLQNGLGALQENGRYAVRQIAADLQQAGYGGCLSPHLVYREDGPPRVINIASSPPTYLTEFQNGTFLVGRNDQAGTLTIGGVNMVPGTDSIEIRGPLRSNINMVSGPMLTTDPITIVGAASGFATNEYLLISDCGSATILRAASVTAGSTTTTITYSGGALAAPYQGDAVVMEFATHTYFVGSTGRNNASGQAITALYRWDGAGSATELVDGVENMQIEYALDTDADGRIEQFVSAGVGIDLTQAVAVRISLLLNSIEGAGADEVPYTYFPSGSTQISPGTGDYRLRQEFSSVVSIRNAVL